MNSHARVSLVATVLVLAARQAAGSDLSYTFVDFGAINVETSATGTQFPAPAQRVDTTAGEGDGLSVAGSLALGRRFYVGASFDNAVVDVQATVTSPLAAATLSGNFDLVTSRVFLGYIRPIGATLDVLVEASYDSAEYDFGSFAGENFDVDDSGAALGVGLRWNPNPALEVFATARKSAVGEVDLNALRFDSGLQYSAGVRWYFFQDLGLGVDYRGGDVESLTVSMRFGFGELRAGRGD